MLHQWQRLATPHMANLLEMRPGVQVKGGDKAELEEDEVYNLNDYEEDGMLPYPSVEHAYPPVDHAHSLFSCEYDSDAKSDESVFEGPQWAGPSGGDEKAADSRCQHQSEFSSFNVPNGGPHAIVNTLLDSGRNACVVM